MKKVFLMILVLLAFIISCGDGGGTNDPIGGGNIVDEDATVPPVPHDEPYVEEPKILFDVSKVAPVQWYRIPGIAALEDGNTIVAVADNRYQHATDVGQSGKNIDVTYRVSTNRGATWTTEQIMGEKSVAPAGTDARGDPLIFEAANGDVVVMAVGGGGWFQGGNPATPSLMWISRSTDRGATWSNWKQVGEPVFSALSNASSNRYVKGFPSSGRGTTLEDGTLAAAMLVGNAGGGDTAALYIYSDDHGETWKAGGLARQANAPSSSHINEPKVMAEMEDGRLMMTIRPSAIGVRWYSYSSDRGKTWTSIVNTPTIQDGRSNAEGIRYISPVEGDTKSRLLHLNANSTSGRKSLTVFMSTDEWQTVQKLKVLQPLNAAYSSIDVLRDGTIITFAEEQANANGGDDLTFRRFNLFWLTDGADYPGKE